MSVLVIEDGARGRSAARPRHCFASVFGRRLASYVARRKSSVGGGLPLADSGDDGEGDHMSAYADAKHAEAQRRRADLLAQVELAERAGCKSMAAMAEFLNRSGFHNAEGGPWNAHSFQTSLARLRASTPDTAEERPGADVAGP